MTNDKSSTSIKGSEVEKDNSTDINDLLAGLSLGEYVKKTCVKLKNDKNQNNEDEKIYKQSKANEEKKEKLFNADDASKDINEDLIITNVQENVTENGKSTLDKNDDPENTLIGIDTKKEAESDSDNESTDSANSDASHSDEENDDKIVNKNTSINDEDGEKEKVNYLTRGPLIDHKNHGYRFSPMLPQESQYTQPGQNQFRSSFNENGSMQSSMIDTVDFNQMNSTENFNQAYGCSDPSNFYSSADNYSTSAQLSPASLYSYNSQSPFYSNGNICGYPTEDGQENRNYCNYGSNFIDGDQSKDSQDVVNIINNINRNYENEPEGIPETEILKWRNALEGNEDSIRDDVGMQLKNEDNQIQSSFTNLEQPPSNESIGNFLGYETPLTPPKSISPVQDCFNIYSPASGYQKTYLNSFSSEEELVNDILQGINDINPDDFNIYLDGGNNACDPSYARNIVQKRCKPNKLDRAIRQISSISAEFLCKKDRDGDTCLMILYTKAENDPEFYENIFSVQERLKEIRVCCDTSLGKAKRCKICGNNDPSKFYSPLSMKNQVGDTALSCSVKMELSEVMVNYLLYDILQCKEDSRRVFDEKGRNMLSSFSYKYPSLLQYM